MAENYVQGNKLYIAGKDLSSSWTAISLMAGREKIDWTKGSDTTRVAKMGLLTGALEVELVQDFADDGLDEKLEAVTDLVDAPVIIGPPGSTSGDENTLGWALRVSNGDYSVFSDAKIGDRVNAAISALAARAPGIVRGTFMHAGGTARTATFNGTARQLGAVSATQKLYACIMCLSASAGDTLDGSVESDDEEAFG